MFSKVSFEIQVEREGRWVIEAAAEEEEQAHEVLQRLMRTDLDLTGAKIMKQTVSVIGNKREGEIFIQMRDTRETPITLTGNPDTAPLCKTAGDCFDLPARMAMARLLKIFLDKFQITPLEFLHSQSYQKKFDEINSLYSAAFHQVGAAQARRKNIPKQQRIDELMEFYSQIQTRAKKFIEMRKSLPGFLPDEINTTHAALLRNNKDNAPMDFNYLLAFHFQTGEYNAREQKVSAIINWFAQAGNDQLRTWLDEWLADFLCFPEVLTDLLGKQFNFYEFLLRLTEVIYGNKQFTKSIDNALLIPLREVFAARGLPLSRAVLTDRLVREIRSEEPLDRREIEREETLIKELEEAMRDSKGQILGGTATQEAMTARKARERKRKLRALGMDDAAGNLG